jgi:hypothetical protein
MIYIIYGNNQQAMDRFLADLLKKNPQSERLVIEDFKIWETLEKAVLQNDTLFGKKSLIILKNLPKNKLEALENLIKVKKSGFDIVLYYFGEELSLQGIIKWVKKIGGEAKEFSGFTDNAVFRFLDTVSSRNLKGSILNLCKLKEKNENIFLVISFLFTRLEKILLAFFEPNERLTKSTTLFTPEEIINMEDSLLNIDYRLKSMSLDPFDEVENWLIDSLAKKQ